MQRTLHRNPVRPQLQVIFPSDRTPSSKSLLNIVEVTVDDLLGKTQRAVEDLSDLIKLRGLGGQLRRGNQPRKGYLGEEVRVWRRDGRVVFGRRARVRCE